MTVSDIGIGVFVPIDCANCGSERILEKSVCVSLCLRV